MTSPRRVPADLRKRGGSRGADESTASLILGQFFVGGFFLFIVAFFLASTAGEDYDGITSLIGAGIIAVVLSVVSMIAALLIGLPLRLVSSLRERWLAHGEVTVIGTVAGLGACIAFASIAGASGGADQMTWWALAVSWSVFAFSVAHFVWPRRGRRRAPRRPRDGGSRA